MKRKRRWSFRFMHQKEDNEVEEDDERIFLENMRSCSINKGKEEKLFCKWRKRWEVVCIGEIKEEGHFCLNRVNFFVFWLVGYICKNESYFNPFNQLSISKISIFIFIYLIIIIFVVIIILFVYLLLLILLLFLFFIFLIPFSNNSLKFHFLKFNFQIFIFNNSSKFQFPNLIPNFQNSNS